MTFARARYYVITTPNLVAVRKILFLSLALLPAALFAQTTAQKLESAVRIYNSMRDFEDSLTPGKVSGADIDKMTKMSERGIPLLDEVISNGTTDEAKAARYFRANFHYELGFVDGMMGRNRDAYAQLSPIKDDYEYYSYDKFPMTYAYDGKTYSIAYDNFAPTLAEYYTGMSEICANLSKNSESLEWARRAYKFSYTTDWYKYIAANKIVEVKKKQDEYDRELLDMSLGQLEALTKLDTSYHRTIKENNYPTQVTGYNTIKTTLSKHPELSQGGYFYGKAARLLSQLSDAPRAMEFYRSAIEAGYGEGDKQFLFDVADLASRNSENGLLVLAADKISERGADWLACPEWSRVEDFYKQAGETVKASAARDKQRECQNKVDEEERRRRKQEHRSDLGFHFYGGIYPLALLPRYNRYRDYGGVVGIGVRKCTIEFSYKMINRNRVFYDDKDLRSRDDLDGYKEYWDGSRMSVALKFGVGEYSSSNGGTYVGPLVEVVTRNYEPMSTTIYSTANNAYVGYQTFSPVEKSYALFLNTGSMIEGKHVFVDYFMGFGVAHHTFDPGVTQYGDANFTFDNPVLQYRKPERFGLVIRVGMTVGLTTAKR